MRNDVSSRGEKHHGPGRSTMSNNPQHSQAMRDAVERLWNEGHLSASEIGDRLGISKNSVVGLAHRMNLARRGSPIIRDDSWATGPAMAEARQLWDNGIPIKQIAAFLGVPENTFASRRRYLDWPHRGQALSSQARWIIKARARKYQSGDGAVRRKAARPGGEAPGNPPANAVEARLAPPAVSPAPVRAGGPTVTPLWPGTCQYIAGESRPGLMCGAPVKARGKSYCADHHRLCLVRVRDLREIAA